MSAQKKKERKPLYGVALIIDPGHGGKDPGASRIFNGTPVVENEYVYDVALRVQRIAKAEDGLAFLTLRSDEEIRSDAPNKVLVDDTNEKFALNKKIARAGASGLRSRQVFGNSVVDKYEAHQVVWISIHFDVVGARKDIEGARIVYAKASPRSLALAQRLQKSFGPRMRSVGPIAESGSPKYGLRNLYILNGKNKAPAKILVELGNFNNDKDLWRIRDPEVREAYARAIVEGLR